MSYIELPGGATPIPPETWSGPAIPEVISALLQCDPEAAFQAYGTWALRTGIIEQVTTFPISDVDILQQLGRPNLAQALLDKGIITIESISSEPFYTFKQ